MNPILTLPTAYTDFIGTLDKRYAEKNKKEGTLVARKTCSLCGLSSEHPRPGVPDWVVDPDLQNG